MDGWIIIMAKNAWGVLEMYLKGLFSRNAGAHLNIATRYRSAGRSFLGLSECKNGI